MQELLFAFFKDGKIPKSTLVVKGFESSLKYDRPSTLGTYGLKQQRSPFHPRHLR